jgi:hypothetical protein
MAGGRSPAWCVGFAATLSTTRPGRFDPEVPWRAVVDSKGPGSAIIRIQSAREGGKAGKASADFSRFNEATEGYGDAEVVFIVGTGLGPLAGNRVIQHDFDFPFDRRPGMVIRWRGEGQVKIDPQTTIADGVVKADVWHDIKKANGSGSTAQDAKDAPECYIQGMIFKSR